MYLHVSICHMKFKSKFKGNDIRIWILIIITKLLQIYNDNLLWTNLLLILFILGLIAIENIIQNVQICRSLVKNRTHSLPIKVKEFTLLNIMSYCYSNLYIKFEI